MEGFVGLLAAEFRRGSAMVDGAERALSGLVTSADFHSLKPLEDFDWSFNPSVHKKEIFDLASAKFIREAKDVVFLGRPASAKPIWPRPSATRPSR